MIWKKWQMPIGAGLLAFAAVSTGSYFEKQAHASLHGENGWDYYEECGSGCSTEETKEYYKNGAFKQEVILEPGTLNREETLELTGHRQSWCYELLVSMAYSYTDVEYWTRCEPAYPTLGY
jgi:hypothetical protein